MSIFSAKSHAEVMDNAIIERFAEKYVLNNINIPTDGKVVIKVAKIDPRVKFNVCQSDLTANIPENFNGRNLNIKINCADSTPWHTYLAIKIKKSIPVVVAKKAIAKGALLDESNIEIAFIDSYKIRGTYIQDTSLVFGSKAKKKISKAHTITGKNTCMVCKGEYVSIIAKSSTFTIKTSGKALSNGNIGDQINVKNKRSGKIITAQVNAINKVLINL